MMERKREEGRTRMMMMKQTCNIEVQLDAHPPSFLLLKPSSRSPFLLSKPSSLHPFLCPIKAFIAIPLPFFYRSLLRHPPSSSSSTFTEQEEELKGMKDAASTGPSLKSDDEKGRKEKKEETTIGAQLLIPLQRCQLTTPASGVPVTHLPPAGGARRDNIAEIYRPILRACLARSEIFLPHSENPSGFFLKTHTAKHALRLINPQGRCESIACVRLCIDIYNLCFCAAVLSFFLK